jgi:acetyl/propionyl-CoA carboxylase alpha subunit
LKATVNNNEFNFEFDKEKSVFMLNGKTFSIDKTQSSANEFHVLNGTKSFNADVVEADYSTKEFTIRVNGNKYKVTIRDKYDELLHALGMDKAMSNKINDLKAPMPGLVLDVLVSEGQQIKKGDSLLVLEAMKMENILKATNDAVVKKVCVSKSVRVEKNEVLIELQ